MDTTSRAVALVSRTVDLCLLALRIATARARPETVGPSEPDWFEIERIVKSDWATVRSTLNKVPLSTGQLLTEIRQLTTDIALTISDAGAPSTDDSLVALEVANDRVASLRQSLERELGVQAIGPNDPAYELFDEYLARHPDRAWIMRLAGVETLSDNPRVHESASVDVRPEVSERESVRKDPRLVVLKMSKTDRGMWSALVMLVEGRRCGIGSAVGASKKEARRAAKKQAKSAMVVMPQSRGGVLGRATVGGAWVRLARRPAGLGISSDHEIAGRVLREVGEQDMRARVSGHRATDVAVAQATLAALRHLWRPRRTSGKLNPLGGKSRSSKAARRMPGRSLRL